MLCWLNFCKIWHQLESPGKRGAPGIASVRLVCDLVCGHLLDLWLMWEDPACFGWCHLWASGSGFYRKASWASHGSKQCFFMVSPSDKSVLVSVKSQQQRHTPFLCWDSATFLGALLRSLGTCTPSPTGTPETAHLPRWVWVIGHSSLP